MSKAASWFLTVSLFLVGLTLTGVAVLSGRLATEANRYATLYALGGCSLFLLVLGLLMPLFAENPYRKMVRVFLAASSTGMFMIFAFVGFMWIIAGSGTLKVMLLVFPLLYGFYLMTAGVFNLYLSDCRNLVFFLYLSREVPYLYYRSRI